MSDEKLIPVRDAGELRPGMRPVVAPVEGSPCVHRVHRYVMLGLERNRTGRTSDGLPCAVAARVHPKSCGGNGNVAIDVTIREGRLYRVDDGLTDGELERERAVVNSEATQGLIRAMRRAREESAKGGVR